MWQTLFLKLLAYGHLGFLIEIWFTGLHGLILRGDKRMKATTYLPMLLIYGLTALLLEVVSEAISWPFYLKAFIYVPIIFFAEGLSAWIIKRIIGRVPWDYGVSHWTPFGFVNFKYTPFWLILAMAFDPITSLLTKVIQAITLATM